MRTHTTKTLKELVVDKMDPQKYEMTDHECDVWMQSLPEIEREMIDTMQFFSCHLFDKGMKCRQYQQIHRECIYLLDKADKLGLLTGKAEKLRLALIACLDAIVEKLLTDYGKFIDLDHLMPLIHLRREQERTSLGITALKAMFDSLNVPSKMQNEVFYCMKAVIQGQRCLYTRMVYVRSLLEGLPEVCRNSSRSRICDDLLHFLVERNYNTEGFVNYYMKFVKDELAETVEDKDKKQYLDNLEWKLRSRTYRKSVYRYDDTRTHVKQVLHDFVCAELAAVRERIAVGERMAQDAYRASQIGLGLRVSESMKKPEQANGTGEKASNQFGRMPAAYKIRTPMTVDMLAYFIKLMVKARVIEPGVRTELFAFAAGIFQTPSTGSAGISPGSLNNKYKTVVQSTAKGVRTLVARMLKEIDEEFEMGN